MEDNSVLIGVTLLESLRKQLKSDERSQLSRNNLEGLKSYAEQALVKWQKTSNYIIMSNLVAIAECISSILTDSSVQAVDSATKDLLLKRADTALSESYVVAAKWYDTEHEFVYTPAIRGVLQRIIENAIDREYYFGRAKG